MKIMIASDIHGSSYYCNKMLEAFRNERADKLLLLGDILYHGPRNDLPKDYNPKAIIEQLNGIKTKILCVRGNCDTEADQRSLQFPILADYCILYVGSHMVFATHGHHFNEENLPPIGEGDVLLYGHTHIPKCIEHKEYLCFNPGSVSIPRENSEHSYMTLTEHLAEWKTLDGVVYQSFDFRRV